LDSINADAGKKELEYMVAPIEFFGPFDIIT